MNLNQIKADLRILEKQDDVPQHVREIAAESLEAIEYLERELEAVRDRQERPVR